jgi:hypothetical protein
MVLSEFTVENQLNILASLAPVGAEVLTVYFTSSILLPIVTFLILKLLLVILLSVGVPDAASIKSPLFHPRIIELKMDKDVFLLKYIPE